MKTLLIIICILVSSSFIYSQNNYEQILDSITKDKSLEEQFKLVSKEVGKYNTENLQLRLFYSRAMVDIATKTQKAKLIGKAYYDLAYSYEIIGQVDLGIEACFEALKHLEEAQDNYLIGMTYNEIGLIYSASGSQDDLDKAIEYFHKFLIIQSERGDTAEIAGAYSNIGLMYIYLENADSAYYYSKLALDLRLKIKQERSIPISLGNVGIALFYYGENDSALVYYAEAEKYYTKSDNKYGLNEVYRNYIIYYLQTNDLEKLKFYVDKFEENSAVINSRNVTKMTYLNKYEYYKAKENYKEALNNYENYKAYSDSINDDRTKDRIANVEAVYQLDKREKEIDILKQKEKLRDQEEKSRKQRTTFTMVVVILIIVTNSLNSFLPISLSIAFSIASTSGLNLT